MSYQKALEALQENLRIIEPGADPAMYNLSVALVHIVQAIQADLARVTARLDEVRERQ